MGAPGGSPSLDAAHYCEEPVSFEHRMPLKEAAALPAVSCTLLSDLAFAEGRCSPRVTVSPTPTGVARNSRTPDWPTPTLTSDRDSPLIVAP